MVIEGIIKGDSIEFELTLGFDITGYKIRAEIYDDCNHSIQLANDLSGGDDTQIEVTDATNGIFLVKVEKGKTDCFADTSNFELEIEDTTGKLTTVLCGDQNQIQFCRQQITWDQPS